MISAKTILFVLGTAAIVYYVFVFPITTFSQSARDRPYVAPIPMSQQVPAVSGNPEIDWRLLLPFLAVPAAFLLWRAASREEHTIYDNFPRETTLLGYKGGKSKKRKDTEFKITKGADNTRKSERNN